MKASLRGLPSGHRSLRSSNATLLKSTNVSTERGNNVKIRKKSIAIIGGKNNRPSIKANKRATRKETMSNGVMNEAVKETKEAGPGNRDTRPAIESKGKKTSHTPIADHLASGE